ncbi:MAG: hypothetical protein K8S13_24615, partial [Desulfobacula sp.]|uniref:hypothetical protein n=1 Tax=Desulfobacula sp. TaxID=2593537 RepID=UPI0025C5239E
VLFDNDKKDVVKDLTKSNLLDEGEYHIFKKGEFEDYIPSNILANSLNDLSPGLNITEEHISEERTKNKRTVKIINDFYRKKGDAFVFPGKPALSEISAKKMVNSKCIPEELNGIIKKIMSL